MEIFKSANILIPKKGTDFSKWSVVACDQYTSEPDYWERVKKTVGNEPSTLNMIFPEVYLENSDASERIKAINAAMLEYLNAGVFEELHNAYIYVERTQSDGRVRHGIIGMFDLEAYDFSASSQSPIRATEGTIIERIPPRKRIRENACLEFPHIMMLADDKENDIFAPLAERKSELRELYNFDLMENSGHISGYLLDDAAKAELNAALDRLYDRRCAVLDSNKAPLVFAVGDGNHSLATAKTCWEELKKTLSAEEQASHPSRFALAELVNLYDDALTFEAIHRVVFDVDPEVMLKNMLKYYPEASYTDNGGQKIGYVHGDKSGTIYVKNGKSNLPVGTLQHFIDDYIRENGGRVDYIHGESVVKTLASEPCCIGFIVDATEKTELYPTVIKDGSLPRKTFSMGEAADKRFYLEAKRIR